MVPSTETPVRLETADGVARVTLNRPDQLNAMSGEMLSALAAVMDQLRVDRSVNVVLISGAGRAFCAGADLGWLADCLLDDDDVMTADVNREEINRQVMSLFNLLWDFPVPIVLKVHGQCKGMGALFVAFSDLVISDETAVYGSPEVRTFALDPCFAVWPFLIGIRWTRSLLFTGQTISATKAAEIGMINEAVPAEALDGYIEDVLTQIAGVSRNNLIAAKRAVNSMYEMQGLYPMMKAAILADHGVHMEKGLGDVLRSARAKGTSSAVAALRDEASPSQ